MLYQLVKAVLFVCCFAIILSYLLMSHICTMTVTILDVYVSSVEDCVQVSITISQISLLCKVIAPTETKKAY